MPRARDEATVDLLRRIAAPDVLEHEPAVQARAAHAIRLGRATLSTIRANVAAALAIKLVTVALALAGVATLWMAVLADVGGSLIVVANALRLLRTK